MAGGDEESARQSLESQRAAGAAFHAGLLHAALGELDAAFDTIGSALPLEWDEALYLRYFRERPVDVLRSDPRWAELIKRLDEGWGA